MSPSTISNTGYAQGDYAFKQSKVLIAKMDGVKGDKGCTGLDIGPNYLGPTGANGIQGVTGLSGSNGNQGATGVGIQGVTGLSGLNGIQGVTGLIGTTGLIGQTGIGQTGMRGIAGSQGSTGTGPVQGATGVAGVQGNPGVTGVGSAGIQGSTGSQGATGAGIQGATGVGTQGVTGPGAGQQGVTGLQGIQGVTGIFGLQGNQGPQGVTGLSPFFLRGTSSLYPVIPGDGLTGIGDFTCNYIWTKQIYFPSIGNGSDEGLAITTQGSSGISNVSYIRAVTDGYTGTNIYLSAEDSSSRQLKVYKNKIEINVLENSTVISGVTGTSVSTALGSQKANLHLNKTGVYNDGYLTGLTWASGTWAASDTFLLNYTDGSGSWLQIGTSNSFNVGGKLAATFHPNGGMIVGRGLAHTIAENLNKTLTVAGNGGIKVIGQTGICFEVCGISGINGITGLSPLKVDITTNKVGIGVTGPSIELDVGNNIGFINQGNNQCLAKKMIAGCTGMHSGHLVRPSTTLDNGVVFTTPISYDPIGVIVSPSGSIANGSDVWVGIAGQVEVFMSGITGIRGSTFSVMDKDGANGVTGCALVLDTTEPDVKGHWGEIGHCLKNYAIAGGTGVCILHFN